MGTLSGVVGGGVGTRQLKCCAVTAKTLCWFSHPRAAVLVLGVRKAPDVCCQISFGGSSVTVTVQHGGLGVLQQNQELFFLSIDVMQTPQP